MIHIGDTLTCRRAYADDESVFTEPLLQAAEIPRLWRNWRGQVKYGQAGHKARRELVFAIARAILALANAAGALGEDNLEEALVQARAASARDGKEFS